MRQAAAAATIAFAMGVVLTLGLSCSSGIPQSTTDALDRLPDALAAAQDAVDAVLPIIREHTEGEDREIAETALQAVTDLCDMGEHLTRDLSDAAESNTWTAWASKIAMFLGRVLSWVKTLGVPIPDELTTALEAAGLLIPAFAD